MFGRLWLRFRFRFSNGFLGEFSGDDGFFNYPILINRELDFVVFVFFFSFFASDLLLGVNFTNGVLFGDLSFKRGIDVEAWLRNRAGGLYFIS